MGEIIAYGLRWAPGAKVYIVGHSLGGAVAAYLAADSPGVTIVTMDSPVNGAWTGDDGVLDVYCNNSVGLLAPDPAALDSVACNLMRRLPALGSPVAADLRSEAVRTRISRANAIHFANQADMPVPSWFALNPAATHNVLVNQRCITISEDAFAHHGCITSVVAPQVAAIISEDRLPEPTSFRRTLNVTVLSETQTFRRVPARLKFLAHGGQVLAEGVASNRGEFSMEIPWVDVIVESRYGDESLMMGALPAHNSDLHLIFVHSD